MRIRIRQNAAHLTESGSKTLKQTLENYTSWIIQQKIYRTALYRARNRKRHLEQTLTEVYLRYLVIAIQIIHAEGKAKLFQSRVKLVLSWILIHWPEMIKCTM
jgi:hypothetical protein